MNQCRLMLQSHEIKTLGNNLPFYLTTLIQKMMHKPTITYYKPNMIGICQTKHLAQTPKMKKYRVPNELTMKVCDEYVQLKSIKSIYETDAFARASA